MLWIVFGIMLLAAALVVAWPQYREERRLTARSALAIVAVLAVSATIYSQIGEPTAQDVIVENDSIEEMVDSLARRLESEPEDLNGWKMLGRSYAQLKRYPNAIAAYERAVELENYTNGQTLVDLGEAIMLNDGSAVGGRAAQLFENALAVTPKNPKALFYGGIAAIERGEPLLAADRWETLLATSPPPEIEGVLRQRVAEWRGTAVPESLSAAEPVAGMVITVNVQLDEAASQAIDPDATIFIIARDPAQPSPPIAAVRRQASELPFDVTVSDGDSMIAGRTLGNFQNLEIVVRASASGQPMPQSGDWFGSQTIDTSTTLRVDIVVNRQVP